MRDRPDQGRSPLGGCAAALLAAIALASAARADPVAEFYRGRTLTLVVGYGPSGGYDLIARMLARHLGRRIPGNPSIVVQNMPGAGGLRATNWLHSVAPRDGTVLGIIARDMPLLAVLGINRAAAFDPRRFTWLGSASDFSRDAYLLMVRADAPAQTIEAARRPGGPALVLGGTAAGATGSDVPMILRDTVGINVKLVEGYQDSGAIFLAVDRGEIDGRTVDLSSMKSFRPAWMAPNGGMRALVQFARATRHPELPDVPIARELARNDAARQVIEVAELSYLISRPFAAPPDVPAERAKALQDAFMAVHRDAAYLDEAARLRMELSPIDSRAVLDTIDRIAGAPPGVLDDLRRILAGAKGG
jgi:tripartite-type tricarboxylate transporter receptor subunit TctC